MTAIEKEILPDQDLVEAYKIQYQEFKQKLTELKYI
jgi:hypothetical protein